MHPLEKLNASPISSLVEPRDPDSTTITLPVESLAKLLQQSPFKIRRPRAVISRDSRLCRAAVIHYKRTRNTCNQFRDSRCVSGRSLLSSNRVRFTHAENRHAKAAILRYKRIFGFHKYFRTSIEAHQGKRKLQKAPPQNNQGTCTSVRIDLSIPITDDNFRAYQAVTESLVLDWLYVEIFTIGQPMHECDFCGALMWYEERSEKTESLVLDYRGLTHHKKNKDLNIGELLAEGGGDEDGDPNMTFNLMTVAGTRNAAFLEELLRARLDPDNGDSKGRTPLHIAASRGHEECNRAVGRDPTCLGQTVCVFVAIWFCMIGRN